MEPSLNARHNQIRNIYGNSSHPFNDSNPKSKVKATLLPYKEKEFNIFKMVKPKEKAKPDLDQNTTRSSKIYRELEIQMLMATRKHWAQMEKLKQSHTSKLKEIQKQKRANSQKAVELTHLNERVQQLKHVFSQQQQEYLYMTNRETEEENQEEEEEEFQQGQVEQSEQQQDSLPLQAVHADQPEVDHHPQ